jgi:hypothetical protein
VATLGVTPTGNGRTNPFDDGLNDGRYSTQVTRVGIPQQSLTLLFDAAESIATEIVTRQRASAPCLGAARPERTCIDAMLSALGALAFRRPLTAEEIERYGAFVTANLDAEGADGALRIGVAALLSSPHFAFRWERGAGTPDASGRVKLAPHELASALSYTILDAPPDAALLAAATSGQLATTAGVESQVKRLLGDGGSLLAARRFLQETFRYPLAAGVFKDAKQFPGHDGAALADDADRLVARSLSQRRDFLGALFGAPDGFARAATAASYGLPSAPRDPAPVTYPAGQRAGLLTQPAFLVAFSDADKTHPVGRGRLISQEVLCRPVPEIPLTEVPPLPARPDATMREKLAVHTANPACAGCHALMDPFGLALERYDHAGRYRTHGEGGKPIDASGVLAGAGSEGGPFDGPVALAGKLARSPVVRACFVRQALRYWLGRAELPADACVLARAEDAYTRSGGDAVALFTALLTSDSFLLRTTK